jgi:hypothetical protein
MAKYNQKQTVMDELSKQNKSEFDKLGDKIVGYLDPIIEATIRKSVPRLLKQAIRETLKPAKQQEEEVTLDLL